MSGLRATVIAVVTLAVAAAGAVLAAERRVLLDPKQSKVTFTLEATAHDVEGVLALKSGEVNFDPVTGVASGDVVVQLAGATTGNDRRDKKMHGEVLETPKFPAATFHLRRVTGTFVENGASQLGLEGVLSFHGTDRPLKVSAKVTSRDGNLTAELEVPIPFVEWGLNDPSVFVLRVEKVVTVHVVAKGTLRDPAPEPHQRPATPARASL